MADRMDTAASEAPPAVLRLFVAGNAPNSRIARANLARLCEGLPGTRVEIVDVLEHPETMLEQGIYLTPALRVVEPPPGGLLYGNLNDESALAALLAGPRQ